MEQSFWRRKMITKKITQDQVDNLGEKIVDSWDMDDLVSYARDKIEQWLINLTDEEFEEEYKLFFGEEE